MYFASVWVILFLSSSRGFVGVFFALCLLPLSVPALCPLFLIYNTKWGSESKTVFSVTCPTEVARIPVESEQPSGCRSTTAAHNWWFLHTQSYAYLWVVVQRTHLPTLVYQDLNVSWKPFIRSMMSNGNCCTNLSHTLFSQVTVCCCSGFLQEYHSLETSETRNLERKAQFVAGFAQVIMCFIAVEMSLYW